MRPAPRTVATRLTPRLLPARPQPSEHGLEPSDQPCTMTVAQGTVAVEVLLRQLIAVSARHGRWLIGLNRLPHDRDCGPHRAHGLAHRERLLGVSPLAQRAVRDGTPELRLSARKETRVRRYPAGSDESHPPTSRPRASRRRPEPSGRMMYTASERVNAIQRPSRDHAGGSK